MKMGRKAMQACSLVWLTILSEVRMSRGTDAASTNTNTNKHSDSECGLYLAPSTQSPNEPRLGMFAGTDIAAHTAIGQPDLAIPVINLDLHNGLPKGYVPQDYFQFPSNFFWDPSSFGADYETVRREKASEEVKSGGGGLLMAVPGSGSLGADHPSVSNARWDLGAVLHRVHENGAEEEEGRGDHPARGSYTHFYNITLQSSKFIPRGMQVFQDTGAHYDDSIYTTKPSSSSSMTLKPVDYRDADSLLHKIQTFLTLHTPVTNTQQRQNIYEFFLKDVLRIAGTQGWNQDDTRNEDQTFLHAILDLFPSSHGGIAGVLDGGGTFESTHPETMRTISWLEDNGQCLDHIYPKSSTLTQQVGRGAFARREIPVGGLVGPAPLLIIDKKDYLDMVHMKLVDAGDGRKKAMRSNAAGGKKVVHKQMLLNYCYGHAQSSLLFFPYGMGVNFINHQPTNVDDDTTKDSANAKIVWSQQSYNQSPTLSSLPPKELLQTANVHLSLGFDIIATRPIQPHEEIFIDYGEEWTDAWRSHVEDQKYPKSWPVRALDLNTRASDDAVIHTLDERTKVTDGGDRDPYNPRYVATACYYASEPLSDNDTADSSVTMKRGYTLRQFPPNQDLTETAKLLHSCDILERNDDDADADAAYTVFFHPEGDSGDIYVKGVPREAIVFVDVPYQSDAHMLKTFRHPIGIPDEMFPDAWRDLK